MGSGDVQKLAKWLEKWIVWELQKQDPVAGYSRVVTSRARAALQPRPPGRGFPFSAASSARRCLTAPPAARRGSRRLPLRSAVLAESCDTDAALLLLSVLDSACSASPRPSQHGDDVSRPPPRTAFA